MQSFHCFSPNTSVCVQTSSVLKSIHGSNQNVATTLDSGLWPQAETKVDRCFYKRLYFSWTFFSSNAAHCMYPPPISRIYRTLKLNIRCNLWVTKYNNNRKHLYNNAQKGTDGHLTRATGGLTLWHIVGEVGWSPFHSEVNPWCATSADACSKQTRPRKRKMVLGLFIYTMRITQARHIRKAPAWS